MEVTSYTACEIDWCVGEDETVISFMEMDKERDALIYTKTIRLTKAESEALCIALRGQI
jgi:hypothetical protein